MAYEIDKGVKEEITPDLKKNLRAVDDLFKAFYKAIPGSPGMLARHTWAGGAVKVVFADNRFILTDIDSVLKGRIPDPKKRRA
jgi:hypothetical protein